MLKYVDCIDSGTEFCPCSLAERGECIICSQLRDKRFCDCLNWKGTCIYQNYIWNMERAKKAREYMEFSVLEKKFIREDIFILKVQVDSYLARELNEFGAYVFMKRPGDGDAYNTPISILDSNINDNVITTVIKVDGVKTKALKIVEDKILIKGPHYNGIQGVKNLKELENGSCLILGRGVGTAPTVLATKKMLYKNNSIYALLDKGRSDKNFSGTYFEELGCKDVEDVNFLDENGELLDDIKIKIKYILEKMNIDVVFSAGSDNFHEKILTYVYGLNKNIKFATINNTTICCGEGICGSCHIKSKKGEVIKACKQQYNPAEIFVKER
ncbi:sulfide/dihydroorotate dehydrogenase-like FAD/NAD-binding protein [Clostridium cylindrosporum]|uniref:Dihydroorotate dehydrogenase electron transfer subunit n=1 Tax=Clostridium cylindrosporum DSM 605 TaxID=1121307 RepID=A0A0J8D5F1_CLOCY|nr:sulfide/dihydroorotate dehydrogenase-like FAD/NAD-binding protein [Clostridium cylindrosporum]KMT21375.1 dihydroorotate dehydrogenase electron transfer subunit [Clostridium cylindrosporum DSM 605]